MLNKVRLTRKALLSALTAENKLPDLEETVREQGMRLRNLEHCLDAMIQSPKHDPANHAAFNGQRGRLSLVDKLFESCRFDLLLETGTFLGETTAYLANRSNLTVHTCEINYRFHALAKMRLAEFRNINFFRGDSREFLTQFGSEKEQGKFPFIYLDAHWYKDLPLKEELEIIDRTWDRYLIMVDDFKVPFDDGYFYDDYGPGKRLDAQLVASASTNQLLSIYYPSLHSSEENGAKRGCAVIVSNRELSDLLEHEELLNSP